MPRLFDALYLLVLWFLSPWLVWRSLRTGRYRQGLTAKLLGAVPIAPPPPRRSSRPRVWFHAVSVGEVHLLVPLIQAFTRRFPGWECVISSTTDTGLAEAHARFPSHAVIPWPFDFSWAIEEALHRVQPDMIVLAEAELWPNFLHIAHQKNIPVVVINARLSPRSFRRMRRVAGLARRLLFRHIHAIGTQSQEYRERYRQLGVHQVQVTGSIKYDGAAGTRNTPKEQELRRLFFSRVASTPLVIVAGSTHAPEEEIVLRAFRSLRESVPGTLLILVPRHPDRFEEVASILQSSGVTYLRRSQILEPVQALPEVILLDSVGELGAAWALADVGYVGGTLDGHRGGQSMIEPAGYGVPTVFGPHVWNFRDAAQRLCDAHGARQIQSEHELAPRLLELLTQPLLRQQMGQAAQELVRSQQGATARTLDLLESVLAPRQQRAAG